MTDTTVSGEIRVSNVSGELQHTIKCEDLQITCRSCDTKVRP